MADHSTPLILDALTKAMADPGGVLLHGNKRTPGLFSAGARAKEAAQRCLEAGYLRVLQRESKGKSAQEVCALTEKGLTYLLGQVSPKLVLEELVRTLQARQAQVADLVATAHQWQSGMEALQSAVEKVLRQIQQPHPGTIVGPAPSENGSEALTSNLVAALTQWQASGAPGDCPLPELYCRVHAAEATLTIGYFHDSLRRLHEQEKIYLHPWTGPLYEIPEPPYALLVGHEIAYYASIRKADGVTG
jgi:hypothetical protein